MIINRAGLAGAGLEDAVRIIAGSKRGRVIQAPKGRDTRPTLDRVREALFGIIQFEIHGKQVLDLFAGSGALGLEALSRGAGSAIFCDSAREAVKVIEGNIAALGFGAQARVYACDYAAALKSLAARGEQVGLVFIDPPYAAGLADRALPMLAESGLLAEGWLIVVEHAPGLPPTLPPGMALRDRRRYGEVGLSFITAGEEAIP